MTERARHHGYTTTPPEKDPAPEPSFAERVRTLLAASRLGTLATQSRHHAGFPFASLMPFALDAAGRPIVLVSRLAIHTQNLQHDDRASLLGAEAGVEGRNPLGLARVTLLGRMHELPEGEPGALENEQEGAGNEAGRRPDEQAAGAEASGAPTARELYLRLHPEARYWVDYPDFHFRRMEVEEVYFVGGFGAMGWVDVEEYRRAEPDPLLDAADSIIQHMNEDHAGALVLLARREGLTGVEEARMTGVDRLGYQLRVRTGEGMRGLRIGFPGEARTPPRVREMLVEQVRTAREQLSG
jgi:heme iron utilization protein